ncbi:MAG: T9SS type A sorting domain-containing protein [Bacteroidetes bacterium]|nr:T9SS type A sorting domain-containing protein [Bacteroidota bacterium]
MNKKLLFFILFGSILFVFNESSATTQLVNIPDANFKAYLLGDSLINTNGDGEIQVSEASAFTGDMVVNGLEISDLTGIEAFTSLTYLDCAKNYLDSLDVSQNTALTDLYCWGNYLTALDIRNGNNVNITGFNAKKNANLYCISVDNTAYSNANWSLDKDSWAVYSNNCTVGIEDHQLSQPIITTANTITIAGTGTAGIYNLLGKEVAKASLPATIRIKESGVYLVRVETEGRVVTRKVLLSNR